MGLGTGVQSVRSSPGSVGGINGTLNPPGLPNRVLGVPTPGLPKRVLGVSTRGMPEVFRCGDTARRLVLLCGVEYRSRRCGSNGGEFPVGITNVASVTIGSNGGEYPLDMPGPILGGGMVSGAVRSTVVTGCMMGY